MRPAFPARRGDDGLSAGHPASGYGRRGERPGAHVQPRQVDRGVAGSVHVADAVRLEDLARDGGGRPRDHQQRPGPAGAPRSSIEWATTASTCAFCSTRRTSPASGNRRLPSSAEPGSASPTSGAPGSARSRLIAHAARPSFFTVAPFFTMSVKIGRGVKMSRVPGEFSGSARDATPLNPSQTPAAVGHPAASCISLRAPDVPCEVHGPTTPSGKRSAMRA